MSDRGGGTADRKVLPDGSGARRSYRRRSRCPCLPAGKHNTTADRNGASIYQCAKPGNYPLSPRVRAKKIPPPYLSFCVTACKAIPKTEIFKSNLPDISGSTHQALLPDTKPSLPTLQDKFSVILDIFYGVQLQISIGPRRIASGSQ